MSNRVEIVIDGRDGGAKAALAGVRRELLAVDRSAEVAANGMKGFAADTVGHVRKLFTEMSNLRNAIGALAAHGTVRTVLEPAIEMGTFQAQLQTLLGSVDAAKARLGSLADLANSSPFELPQVVEANRALQTLTSGMLSTEAGMRMVGDVAASVGAPIDELAVLFGRLYAGIQSGGQVDDAAMRLQELGVITGDVRGQIERMQEANEDGARVWRVVERAMAGYEGSMERLGQTTEGKLSMLRKGWKTVCREIGEGVLPGLNKAIESLLDKLQEMSQSGELQKWGEDIGKVVSDVTNLLAWLVQFVMDHRQALENLGFSYAVSRIIASSSGALDVVRKALSSATVEAERTALALKQVKAAASSIGVMAVTVAVTYMIRKVYDEAKSTAAAEADARNALESNPKMKLLDKDKSLSFLKDSLPRLALGGLPGALSLLLRAKAREKTGDFGVAVSEAPTEAEIKQGSKERRERLAREGKHDAAVKGPDAAAVRLEQEKGKLRKWVVDLYWGAMKEIESGQKDGKKASLFRALFGSEEKFLDNTKAAYEKAWNLAKHPTPGRTVSVDVGLDILEARHEAKTDREKDEAKRVKEAKDNELKGRRKAIREGIEASKELAELERQWIRKNAERYLQAQAEAARKRERADRMAADKAKRSAERHGKKAKKQWADLYSTTPAQRREREREEKREKRRRYRTRRKFLSRAAWKIQHGQADRLTKDERKAAFARHNELVSSKRKKKAARKRSNAEQEHNKAEKFDKRLKTMRWKLVTDEHGQERWRLTKSIQKGRHAWTTADPAQRKLLMEPPVMKLFADVGKIAARFNDGNP